jgi:hypothetical protein
VLLPEDKKDFTQYFIFSAHQEKREKQMGWLENEMRNIRQQEESRRQQAEIQGRQEEQLKQQQNDERAQAQLQQEQLIWQRLVPIITSLQLHQLFSDAQKIWYCSQFDHNWGKPIRELYDGQNFYPQEGLMANSGEVLQRCMSYHARLYRVFSYRHPSYNEYISRNSIITEIPEILIRIWEVTDITDASRTWQGVKSPQHKIAFSTSKVSGSSWTEEITPSNYNHLLSRLVASFAQIMITIQERGWDRQ